jgi:hypothetical protein
MSAEARSESRTGNPFAPFLGGPLDEPAKAWEESLSSIYKGLFDTWTNSTKPFVVSSSGVPASAEDLARVSGILWKESCSSLATVQDRMEAFAKFAKVQQEGSQEIFRSFVDCVRRVSAAQQEGGIEKAIRTCLEAHGGFMDTLESSFVDQTKAFFECCRSFIPRENRAVKAKKEKAS